MREKARRVAKDKLGAVKREKLRQLEKLAERIEGEWQVERQVRVSLCRFLLINTTYFIPRFFLLKFKSNNIKSHVCILQFPVVRYTVRLAGVNYFWGISMHKLTFCEHQVHSLTDL